MITLISYDILQVYFSAFVTKLLEKRDNDRRNQGDIGGSSVAETRMNGNNLKQMQDIVSGGLAGGRCCVHYIRSVCVVR